MSEESNLPKEPWVKHTRPGSDGKPYAIVSDATGGIVIQGNDDATMALFFAAPRTERRLQAIEEALIDHFNACECRQPGIRRFREALGDETKFCDKCRPLALRLRATLENEE